MSIDQQITELNQSLHKMGYRGKITRGTKTYPFVWGKRKFKTIEAILFIFGECFEDSLVDKYDCLNCYPIKEEHRKYKTIK